MKHSYRRKVGELLGWAEVTPEEVRRVKDYERGYIKADPALEHIYLVVDGVYASAALIAAVRCYLAEWRPTTAAPRPEMVERWVIEAEIGYRDRSRRELRAVCRARKVRSYRSRTERGRRHSQRVRWESVRQKARRARERRFDIAA